MNNSRTIFSNKSINFLFSLQLSELEQRVIEAEERAEEAEDKVKISIYMSQI